jgi:hypothetical protein
VNWQALNLAAPEFAKPSEPPTTCGLIYRGKRHLLSGPPEAAKTLLALIVALEEIRGGGCVAFVDFESGPAETRRVLEDLGATRGELSSVFYFEPDGPPDEETIARIVREGVTLTIFDALAGAYDASELDDGKRADIEKFYRAWIRPLWQKGVATLAIDHVVKNSENRGKFSIGSERKLGTVDVHLGLVAVQQLHRGATGLIRVTTHKDRPAHLVRPQAAQVELCSDPETHRITWRIRPVNAQTEESNWRPTVLMRRVSDYLEPQTDEVSVSAIYKAVKGKRGSLMVAVRFLVADGWAIERSGDRGSRLIRLVKPYRDPSPTRPQPSPNGWGPRVPSVPPPLGGDGDTTRIEIDHDELECLLNEQVASGQSALSPTLPLISEDAAHTRRSA